MTFIELLEELNVPFRRHGEHHHATAGFVNIDCPFCSPGWNKFRLGYSLRSGYFSCWVCGSVRTSEVLKSLFQDVHKERQRELRSRIGRNLRFDSEWADTGGAKLRGRLVLPDKLGPLKEPHKAFIRRKKLDPEEIEAVWKIQGIAHAPQLFWRIFIPIHLGSEVVSWTTRSIKDRAEVRYVSARPDQERINHKDLLYGAHRAGSAVCVVEGPTDVWRGGPGFVATMGTAYRAQQVRRIAKYPVRAIWFDSAAIEQGEALAEELKLFPGTTYLINSDYKDPGSAPIKEIRAVRKLLR